LCEVSGERRITEFAGRRNQAASLVIPNEEKLIKVSFRHRRCFVVCHKFLFYIILIIMVWDL
ncbi:MAG: hypothetical protein K2P54_08075, partial [Odoribacter sp.]|nr:hypothetical protein [Odoribacter sp.]